ncbi:hypothetical protein GWI33_008021 [Rhynchophorus ferrugineus]|uniref:Uncharacterized protein n=1 Tax=Rhynchophorus ferrugineus TaxID=354439 RepID=A0A834ITF9_RHYFE|nr:hypothetical protein GWI33_008021 [Rhynchophorus ferrugineus]
MELTNTLLFVAHYLIGLPEAVIIIKKKRDVYQPRWAKLFNSYIALYSADDKIIPPGCCILPSCKPTGKCYQMLSCGHVCTAGYARGYFNTRASYKIREYYEKLKCRNDICRIERIYCRECLSPQSSISSTDIDCERCYYQK